MEQLINYLIVNGKAWVKSQRESHRPKAEPLPTAAREHLSPYFDKETLESIRVRQVEHIENPEFYEVFEKAGQPIPLDFRAMEGITFIDTILIAESRMVSKDWTSSLFHECVHAVQYQVLGLDRFIEEYVRGWAKKGFDYFSIPLERQAYDLQRVFEMDKQQSFSVEIAVAMGLEESTVIV
jgi:hypothetical protein